jgi:hypothetical protein
MARFWLLVVLSLAQHGDTPAAAPAPRPLPAPNPPPRDLRQLVGGTATLVNESMDAALSVRNVCWQGTYFVCIGVCTSSVGAEQLCADLGALLSSL